LEIERVKEVSGNSMEKTIGKSHKNVLIHQTIFVSITILFVICSLPEYNFSAT
jgi:hypothetical protein